MFKVTSVTIRRTKHILLHTQFPHLIALLKKAAFVVSGLGLIPGGGN